MKKHNYLLILFLVWSFQSHSQPGQKEIGNLVMENIPDIPNAIKERLNQYQNTRSASLVNWSPDGKGMLMSTRFSETAQLHFIDHPGGARRQITFFPEPVGNGSFCPDAAYKGFMFTKDVGGNEFSQLYWFDSATGKYEMISDGGRSQNSLPRWSNKGDVFIHNSTRRNGKDYDLYLVSMQKPKEGKLMLQKGGAWQAVDWSPDDKFVIVGNYISVTKSLVYILNVQTGALEQINPTSEDISYDGGIWSADGKGIFIINDEGSEFATLKYYDVASKKFTPITQGINWDVTAMTVNKKRSTIIFSVNEGGSSKLYRLDPVSKKYTPLPNIPQGVISRFEFHPNGEELGITINTPLSPGDIYSYNLKNNQLTRWTYSETGGIDPATFVSPTLIEFESFDKRKIPAFYYKPKNVSGKIPVIISIHGGPEGQSLPQFSPIRNFYINELGVAVIDPNVRGSTGYGKTYVKLDNGYNREESVKDIGALLDWIAKQPELDASRVVVMGGSYGGYMVLASMVHYSDRLRCGVDVVGISNFVTFLQNTESYRQDLRRVEYGDERDPKMKEFLQKISPNNNVNKITKPLFIIQGLNDPRVPASESEQMKKQMMANGKDVWYLVAKDEGHGFRKKVNVDFQQWATVLFLQEKLIK